MELGMIGLGRMGANMVLRLLSGKHKVVAYNRSPDAVQRVVDKGATSAKSLQDLVGQLASPRILWLMIPSGAPVDDALAQLVTMVSRGDIIIDGGNSYYRDSLRRAKMLKEKGIDYVDVGTSGGIWGLTEGYSMMVGGDAQIVDRLRPIFETLAPAPDKGWGRVGPVGSGHFVKMVHNGIEYGMMQAYAEGFALMKQKKEFALDLHQVSEIWRSGSVVRSWLLDLTAEALQENPDLKDIAPFVADSGEGRWTVSEAIDLDVPAPIITLSLLERLRSRVDDSFGDKLLAAMRQKFGGHAVKRKE